MYLRIYIYMRVCIYIYDNIHWLYEWRMLEGPQNQIPVIPALSQTQNGAINSMCPQLGSHV